MFWKLAGLGLASFACLVVAACSGAPAPTGVVEPEQNEGTTLPPAKSGEKPASDGATAGDASKVPDGAKTDAGKSGSGTPGQGGDGQNGGDGQPGRVSVNEHCCYGGTYFKCPSTSACFGGFDINACLSTCPGPFDPCFNECFDQLSNAPAPKGCQTTTPPAGVDCANGNININ